MRIASPRWPFTAFHVDYAPTDWGGVFVLWKDDELLFIGHANDGLPSIRECLQHHLQGLNGTATRAATHYGWQLSREPRERAWQLLHEYQAQFGQLPAGNR
jgi:hypothetical protein